MRDYYPMYPTESDLFVEEEETDETPIESPRDETFAYLQKIAKTPLLDPQQETALFEKYQDGLQSFLSLLNQFPDWICVSLDVTANTALDRNYKYEPPQSEHGLIISCLLYTSPSPRDS